MDFTSIRKKFRQKFHWHRDQKSPCASPDLPAPKEDSSEQACTSSVVLPSDTHALSLAPLSLSEAGIRDLWDLAYEQLRREDSNLISSYEKKIFEDEDDGAAASFSVAQRREKMQAALQKKMEQVNRDSWKLRFAEFHISTIVSTVSRVNDYVSDAVASNTYASVAWLGVSLLLPV